MDIKPPFALPARERRFNVGDVQLRAAAGENKVPTVRGYAAVFNKKSENFGYGDFQFFEIIEPGAFDDVLKDDVRALFNHDANLILARTKSKTLRIGVDSTGLWYEFEPADTQAGRDLRANLDRGDVDQSSFGFTMPADYSGEKWVREGKVTTRYIRKIARLYDVSPVTYPAYPDTEVSLRSLLSSYDEALKAGRVPDGVVIDPAVRAAHRRRSLEIASRE